MRPDGFRQERCSCSTCSRGDYPRRPLRMGDSFVRLIVRIVDAEGQSLQQNGIIQERIERSETFLELFRRLEAEQLGQQNALRVESVVLKKSIQAEGIESMKISCFDDSLGDAMSLVDAAQCFKPAVIVFVVLLLCRF